MVLVLIVVLLALALLYFWLAGHWFARIVITPILWLIIVASLLAAVFGGNASGAVVLLSWIVAGALAWYLGGVPAAYRRRTGTFLIPYPRQGP